jgi:hypothetical protein
LRRAIDELRTRASLGTFPWTDSTLETGTTMVRAVHLVELRTALEQVYVNDGRTPPSHTTATLGSGTTISATDIAELRAAVLRFW